MLSFAEAKNRYDEGPGKNQLLSRSLVPVDGKFRDHLPIRSAKGDQLEEYYKWQFLYGLIQSALYAKDYIGAEVRFPKGNKTTAPIKLDAAIFNNPAWIEHYNSFWKTGTSTDLEWLNAHLLAVLEFKKGDKEIENVFTGQVKGAMKEKIRRPHTSGYVLRHRAPFSLSQARRPLPSLR